MLTEDLSFDIETNEDDTEIALVVRSHSGRKISQHEFVMQLESYLHDVTQAEIYRNDTGALNH